MPRTGNIINDLRTTIQDNVTDPNSSRRRDDQPWVFTHSPRTNSSKPTVILEKVDSNFEPRNIGGVGQYERTRIQAAVFHRVTTEFDVDSDNELETAEDALDWLVTEIAETVLNNHDTLTSDSTLYSLLPESTSPVLNPDNKIIQQNLDFIAFMERG